MPPPACRSPRLTTAKRKIRSWPLFRWCPCYAKYVYVHSSAVSNVVIDVNQIELSGVTVNH